MMGPIRAGKEGRKEVESVGRVAGGGRKVRKRKVGTADSWSWW